MIMAKVILGKEFNSPVDKSLKEPPEIEKGKNIRYDSVKGYTNGSDVFMIYSNNKAYPMYLITYRP